MTSDVIVIGAGLAGIMGATAACDEGARVILLTRKTVGLATNSAISNGAFAGPVCPCESDEYIRGTLSIGSGLNSLPHVEAVAKGIGPAITFLRSVGCVIEEKTGQYVLKASRPDVIPGVTLMRKAAASLRGLDGLSVRAGFHVTDILTHAGRVCGVKGIDKTGRLVTLRAPAVILASGGGAAIYLRNDNQKSTLGQGYAMALRSGLELRDMEFVQFYPFVLAEPGLASMLLYPPLPKKARLINATGKDIGKFYQLESLNDMIFNKRAPLTPLLCSEMLKGPVYMDLRNVPSEDWAHHPLAIIDKLKFDFRSKPFAVAPAAHFFMGGIRTDAETQTQIPGFLACGEVAWGLHGANRKGGNALSECLVFGRTAGARAAKWALDNPLPKTAMTAGEIKNSMFGPSSSMAILRQLGRQIREIAWSHAGLLRSDEGLRTGLEHLRKTELKIVDVMPQNAAEHIKKSDLLGACLVIRAIMTASHARKESLGSFKREDCSEEKDVSSYGNSSIRYNASKDQVSATFITSGSGKNKQQLI